MQTTTATPNILHRTCFGLKFDMEKPRLLANVESNVGQKAMDIFVT